MMVIVIAVCLFLSVAILTWSVWPNEATRAMRRRIYAEVAKEKRPSVLNQLVKLWSPLNRRLPLGWYNRGTAGILEQAGLQVSCIHFFVIQEMGALTGLIIYFFTLGPDKPINWGWLVLFIVMGFFIPRVWLHNRITGRRMSVSRDLPEVVDLLTLCINAGSDFMSALGRIVREFRPCPVRDELAIVLQEVRVGKRRRDALRAFSTRLKCPEASSFARTLIQVDRMGTGLAEALAVLSEDMRLQRYHWAERFAAKAPLKMLIPLLFSLAAALIIVAGPILLQFFRGGFGDVTKAGAVGITQGAAGAMQ
jgi:Flp pilus assembly protein TadB